MYCTYLTVYSGNKLPPFYIGHSSLERIQNGYHGSVRSKKYSCVWNEELKLNPSLFSTKIISYHNNRKDAVTKEIKLQKMLSVHKNPMYINMSIAGDKFFLEDARGTNNPMYGKKQSEKTKVLIGKKNTGRKKPEGWGKRHSEKMKGRKRTEIHRKRLSESLKGSNNPMYGKHWSDEQKMKRTIKQGMKVTIKGIEYNSKREAARLLGVSRPTIDNWVKNDKDKIT